MFQSLNVPVTSEPLFASVYVNVFSNTGVLSSLTYLYAISKPIISSYCVLLPSLNLYGGTAKKPRIWYLGFVNKAPLLLTSDWNAATLLE